MQAHGTVHWHSNNIVSHYRTTQRVAKMISGCREEIEKSKQAAQRQLEELKNAIQLMKSRDSGKVQALER